MGIISRASQFEKLPAIRGAPPSNWLGLVRTSLLTD